MSHDPYAPVAPRGYEVSMPVEPESTPEPNDAQTAEPSDDAPQARTPEEELEAQLAALDALRESE